MTKLSGKKSKKISFFELIFSKTHLNQNFMLIPMEKSVFIFNQYILRILSLFQWKNSILILTNICLKIDNQQD